MARLSLDKLKSGMITGSEVIDINGHILTKANEELSDSHILLLQLWGINEVDIQSESLVITADYKKEEQDIYSEKVDDRFFLHSNNCPAVHRLKSYMLEKMLNEKGRE